MKREIKNALAFITGSSSGIGKASAELLASKGYDLILCARRAERLQEQEQYLKNTYGIAVKTLTMDIRDRNEVDQCFKNLENDWKSIDVLINNAGLAAGLSTIYEGEIDKWEQMIDTNVKGLLYISRHIMPLMVERNKGQIINISSIAGKEVYPNGNIYCATKHAVDALSKSMRRELAEFNIKVTVINPGAVETEFSLVRFDNDETRAAKVYEGFENLVAQDIAEAIWFCVNRPSHVNINELTIMPVAQPSGGVIFRK